MTKRNITSKLSRCMRAPIRALCRARDFYVRGMNGCAGKMQQGMVVNYGHCPMTLPRSFTCRDSGGTGDDLTELIRMASRRTGVLPRSRSVAVGRIDEEEACEFEGEVDVGESLLWRSRSCAVGGGGGSSTMRTKG